MRSNHCLQLLCYKHANFAIYLESDNALNYPEFISPFYILANTIAFTFLVLLEFIKVR